MPEATICRVCDRPIDKKKDEYKVVSNKDGIEVLEHPACTKRKLDEMSR
jgi:hypothetical protein